MGVGARAQNAQAPTPAPATAPAAPAPAAAAPAARPGSAAGAPSKPFPILEYQIAGNTLLSTIEVERAVMGHLTEEGTIKDIEAARTQLEQLYHDKGYKTVIVTIPQQQVVQGVVRLQVAEAPVGKLHIAGSRYHSLTSIREKVPQLAEGSVPQFGEVQKELGDLDTGAVFSTLGPEGELPEQIDQVPVPVRPRRSSVRLFKAADKVADAGLTRPESEAMKRAA